MQNVHSTLDDTIATEKSAESPVVVTRLAELESATHTPAEVLNWLTHGLGFVLASIGALALLMKVGQTGDLPRIVGCALFASALVGVYAASTLSHVVLEPAARRGFRMLDQALIYLLIVGT